MTIAIWSSRYETGIAHIDSQHRALFAAVNELAESFKAGNSHQKVQDSLGFLMRYTTEHFRDEEQVMRDMDYPGLVAHMAEHTQLVESLHGLKAKVAEGKTVTMDVTIFLADWLTQHINNVDLRYVEFKRALDQR